MRLKQAGQSAGSIAKNAGGNVADAAGKFGSLVKNRWVLMQQSREQQNPAASGESIQERFRYAATSTGALLKKGITETKEKVAVGKLKVEEVKLALVSEFYVHVLVCKIDMSSIYINDRTYRSLPCSSCYSVCPQDFEKVLVF